MKSSLKKLINKLDAYDDLENDAQRIDQLHKIRVNARKLIALSPPESDSAKTLKRLIQASNALRDLDVLHSETLKNLPKDWQPKLQPLYDILAEQRQDMDAQFRLRLQMELSEEILELVEDFEPFKKEEKSGHQRHQLALKEIEKRLKAQFKVLRALEVEDKQVHKVRLKIKRLRYQLEHFYPKQTKALEVTTYLQNTLGEFHDLCQGMKWLEKHADVKKKVREPLLELLQRRKQDLLQSVRQVLNKKYRKIELQ